VTRPLRWSAEQLAAEAARSEALFRSGRLAASEAWSVHFTAARTRFEELFDALDGLDPLAITDERLSAIYAAGFGDTLRYLAGPPISDDDLQKIADVSSLAPATLSRDREALRKVFGVIARSLDPYRFPWFAQERPATGAEKQAAILASAGLMAAQRVATARRHESKREQENAVKSYLASLGMREVRPGKIATIVHGPGAGQFCGEAMLGTRKADIVVRLADTRLLAIECKVSNSALNSVKRINNDAAAKAEAWVEKFGTEQVVPAAMLGGVFGIANLIQAQDRGLSLFWAHDLGKLGEFIAGARA